MGVCLLQKSEDSTLKVRLAYYFVAVLEITVLTVAWHAQVSGVDNSLRDLITAIAFGKLGCAACTTEVSRNNLHCYSVVLLRIGITRQPPIAMIFISPSPQLWVIKLRTEFHS